MECFALGLEDGGDFFPLGYDQRIVDIPVGLDAGKDFHRLFSSADFSKPAWGPREERDPEHEAHSRDELDAPSCAEGGGAGDEGAAVADEEHDEDAPFDGKLLDHDDGTAFFFFGDLGEVHRPWEEVIPTQTPLIRRPPISIP